MSGRGVIKPIKKKVVATPKKKRVARVKRVTKSSLKNTVNIRLSSAAPQLPGVSSGGYIGGGGGGGSSSSSAGAPASTTIFTSGVRDDNANDRILQALTRIEQGGPRTQAGSMQYALDGERFVPIPGPPGPAGRDGRNGRDGISIKGEKGDPGQDSTVAGPAGRDGRNGLDSTVPGPRGERGEQGVSSFVYQPNGALALEQERPNLGRQQQQADVVPNTEDRLVLALERMADRTQERLQPAPVIEQPLAIEDAGRGTAQKRPANQLAAAIDQQALVEANQMDVGGLRQELNDIQRQRRDVFRQAAEGNLAVPLSGIGLTPSTIGAMVRAGPLIEQLPDPSNELAIRGERGLVPRVEENELALRGVPAAPELSANQLAVLGGRALVPDGRITAQRSQELALLRQQVTPPRIMARVATPPRIGGQLVPRGTREIQQFYPPTTEDDDL
jgi:hypothetical protein